MKKPGEFSSLIEKLFKDAQSSRKGILYSILTELDPSNAEEISSYFSISSSASIQQDLEVLSRSHDTQPLSERLGATDSDNDWPIIQFPKKIIMDFNFNFFVGLILLLALGLIGFWTWRKLENEPARSQRGRSARDAMPPPRKGISALCLVIPCNRIEPQLRNSLVPGENLPPRATTGLIGDAVYFLSDTPNAIEKCVYNLNLDDEGWTSFPEDTDLCIHLMIPEGSEMVGVDLKRSLSRKVPNSLAKIKRIGLLKDFKNLERFHRA